MAITWLVQLPPKPKTKEREAPKVSFDKAAQDAEAARIARLTALGLTSQVHSARPVKPTFVAFGDNLTVYRNYFKLWVSAEAFNVTLPDDIERQLLGVKEYYGLSKIAFMTSKTGEVLIVGVKQKGEIEISGPIAQWHREGEPTPYKELKKRFARRIILLVAAGVVGFLAILALVILDAIHFTVGEDHGGSLYPFPLLFIPLIGGMYLISRNGKKQ